MNEVMTESMRDDRKDHLETAFQRGDYALARRLLAEASNGNGMDENCESIRHALGFDPMLIAVAAAMAIVWVAAYLSVS